MNLSTIILAFLAVRAPAAYPLHTILTRINQSSLLDTPATEDSLLQALTTLHTHRQGSLVDLAVDPITKTAHWYATDTGIRRWTLQGRLTVEA